MACELPAGLVRVLLVADTHLGFDLPFRPRVSRRRRGPDFFSNFETALEPAMKGEVDLVVHGGDLFYRSRVPPALVEMACGPLIEVANRGVPVFLVPGNHDRSSLPLHLWTSHPRLHIFDEPRTFVCSSRAGSVALSGFPFARRVRDEFENLVKRTDYPGVSAGLHLLCMHQTVEGAQVGPSDYTFRAGPDVIRGNQIPAGFAAVLCGHIDRSQKLTRDLRGRPLAAPVVYPGAIERTSLAERNEPKHYVLADLQVRGLDGGELARTSFVPLPTRPMVSIEVNLTGQSRASLAHLLQTRLARLHPDSVVRVRLRGASGAPVPEFVTAAWLRALAPATMNISLAPQRRGVGGPWAGPECTAALARPCKC